MQNFQSSHLTNPTMHQISQNAPFCNGNVDTCVYYKVDCGIWDWCIVRFVQQVNRRLSTRPKGKIHDLQGVSFSRMWDLGRSHFIDAMLPLISSCVISGAHSFPETLQNWFGLVVHMDGCLLRGGQTVSGRPLRTDALGRSAAPSCLSIVCLQNMAPNLLGPLLGSRAQSQNEDHPFVYRDSDYRGKAVLSL